MIQVQPPFFITLYLDCAQLYTCSSALVIYKYMYVQALRTVNLHIQYDEQKKTPRHSQNSNQTKV